MGPTTLNGGITIHFRVDGENEEAAPTPEEDLIQDIEIPENLRPRGHIDQLLRVDEENEEKEKAITKAAEVVLKDLKKLYDTAIQPLESLYKYRDLSNRHFGGQYNIQITLLQW